MPVLSLVVPQAFTWSDISDQVNDPQPLPSSNGRLNQQILYYVVANTIDPTDHLRYYLATDGFWYPGPKPPRFHACLYGEVGLAWDAIRDSRM